MRCLYCGKELALLKRWTGGGEFCSDAHRQQYQEEYNQLALNRLLQAKPQQNTPKQDSNHQKPGNQKEEAKPAEAAPKLVQEPAPRPVVAIAAEAPKAIEAARPIALEPQPEPEPEVAAVAEPEIEEEAAPAEMAGMFIELPVPVEIEIHSVLLEDGFAHSLPIELPRREVGAVESELVLAGQAQVLPAGNPVDSGARIAERRLEVRDFVRNAPVVQFDAPFGRPELKETCEEAMDILIFPHPPQPSPQLWNEDSRAFAFGYELGALARVAYRTTGIEDNRDGLDVTPVDPQPEHLVGLATVELARPEISPVSVAPAPAVNVAPVPVVTVRATPPPVQPAETETAVTEAKEPAESDPAPAIKPLPLTLPGLAAGRGKPVQIFQTGVTGDLEIQAPRSTALPLRAVMTLGPAPAPAKTEERKERTVLVKAEPKKPQPQALKPDAGKSDAGRNGKGRQEPEKEAPEPRPVPVAIVKEAPAETLNKSYTPTDLGLPKLTIESNGMSMAVKAGLAAAAVFALAIVLYFALRGSGQTVVAKAPQVVTGAPLTALDSSWITDWGAEPGVRREHEISVLRPSLNLSDYRIEFEAQIETKAIGWVFRAKDGKNYYVGKLEIVTPGLEPVVAAVHFAMINGEMKGRSQKTLPMKVRLDTMYKVRFDALGDHFTTWVQDQKVDDWTDSSLPLGGVGLYNERGERMSLKGGFSAVPLEIRK